jgi:hypothetical protein
LEHLEEEGASLLFMQYAITFEDKGAGISAAGLKRLFREENSLNEHRRMNP